MSREHRYYLSSLSGDAARANSAVRAHRGIENKVHWVGCPLGHMAFREDKSRVQVEHAAQNLAVLRCLTMDLLRQEERAKIGIAARRKRAGWDAAFLLKVLHGLDAIALPR